MGGVAVRKPVIEFKSYQIQHYNFERKKIKGDTILNEEPFSISVTSGITDDLKHGRINIQVSYDLPVIIVDIEVSGYFDTNELETLEQIEEHLIVNGTAIVFPYIRSMVSMLSSLDSENAIILPTINTTNFLKSE